MGMDALAIGFQQMNAALETTDGELRRLTALIDLLRRPVPIRERYPEMRTLYRQGKSPADMATALQISKRQVYKHLTRALHG